jgi:hypothetical protein
MPVRVSLRLSIGAQCCKTASVDRTVLRCIEPFEVVQLSDKSITIAKFPQPEKKNKSTRQRYRYLARFVTAGCGRTYIGLTIARTAQVDFPGWIILQLNREMEGERVESRFACVIRPKVRLATGIVRIQAC